MKEAQGNRPIYAPLDDQIPSFLFRVRVAQVTDTSQTAKTLPPLPVPGASPDRVGVLQVARETRDGRLLAFGVDPVTGVPTEAAMNHGTGLPSQWLWIWDPRVSRWLVWPSPLPVASTWGEGGYQNYGATWVAGDASAGASTAGTYLWVRFDGYRDNDNVAYRVFVPDAPPGQLDATT